MICTPSRVVLATIAGQFWYANNDGGFNRVFQEMVREQDIDIRFSFEVRVIYRTNHRKSFDISPQVLQFFSRYENFFRFFPQKVTRIPNGNFQVDDEDGHQEEFDFLIWSGLMRDFERTADNTVIYDDDYRKVCDLKHISKKLR